MLVRFIAHMRQINYMF